jgi:hypothetical protein
MNGFDNVRLPSLDMSFHADSGQGMLYGSTNRSFMPPPNLHRGSYSTHGHNTIQNNQAAIGRSENQPGSSHGFVVPPLPQSGGSKDAKVTEADWSGYRSIIETKYVKENMSLTGTMQFMENNYKFKASYVVP